MTCYVRDYRNSPFGRNRVQKKKEKSDFGKTKTISVSLRI